MSAEAEVRAALTADAGVIALVADRVFADIGAQGEQLPLIVVERTATEPKTTIHEGQPFAAQVTISVTSWSQSRQTSETIGDAVEVAMHNTGLLKNRFGHIDEATELYASLLEYEVWQL